MTIKTVEGNHEADDMEAGVAGAGNQRGGGGAPVPNAPMDVRS
jgi:hypothetical protein